MADQEMLTAGKIAERLGVSQGKVIEEALKG